MTSRDLVAAAAVPAAVFVVCLCVAGGPIALVLTAVLLTAAATAGRWWRGRSARERRWRAFEDEFWVYVREHSELDRRRGWS